MNLRREVQSMIHRAIDSTVNYTGKEYELNKSNWIQITTDRVIAAIMQSLPPPIDIKNKYETDEDNGIYINIQSDNKHDKNENQLDYLSIFQQDQGWNKFYIEYSNYLTSLYNTPNNVVSSEHEEHRNESSEGTVHGSEEGPQSGQSDPPEDSEPSKVR